MATNNYMPMGRNPRNPAGQNAGYKKGGMTKIAGVMKSGGVPKKLKKAQNGMTFDQKVSANREYYKPTNVEKYNSGKTKQITNPNTGIVTDVRRSGKIKAFSDPSTGESEVYRPRIVGSPYALKTSTNAQGVTTKYDRRGNPTIMNKKGGAKYQDKGTVKSNMVKGVMAINAAAKEAKLEASRPKTMKKIVKIKR